MPASFKRRGLRGPEGNKHPGVYSRKYSIYSCVCWARASWSEESMQLAVEVLFSKSFFFLLYVQLYYACVVKCSCTFCSSTVVT